MTRLRTLCAAVAATLAATTGLVVAAAPAGAVGTCNGGMALNSGTGIGDLSTANPSDWWTTSLPAGTYAVALQPLGGEADLQVTGGSCMGVLCTSTLTLATDTCVVTLAAPSTLNIYVWRAGLLDTKYALDVAPGGTSSIGSCTTASGQTACATYTAGTVRASFGVLAPGATSFRVAGYLDAYTFTLPNGGVATLPCLSLVTGATTTKPCITAGGTFSARILTLTDTTVSEPGALSQPVATVRVCDANLVLTVDGFGVSSFPALTVC